MNTNVSERARRTDEQQLLRIVAALEEVDHYHRLSWYTPIQKKRDAAIRRFESLLNGNRSRSIQA